MPETREIIDLTKYAQALGISIEQLKKELWIEKLRYPVATTRDALDPITHPHASVGGRCHMFWGSVASFISKE